MNGCQVPFEGCIITESFIDISGIVCMDVGDISVESAHGSSGLVFKIKRYLFN